MPPASANQSAALRAAIERFLQERLDAKLKPLPPDDRKRADLQAQFARETWTVDATTQFASNPMLGIEKIKEMFDQTFQAMDAMDNFRAKAIDVMGQNNALIRDQLARADTYVDRTRQAQAREAAGQAVLGTDGPVKM